MYYIRVDLEAWAATYCALREVEAYDGATKLTIAIASISSEYSATYDRSKLINGDTTGVSGYWSSLTTGTGQWLIISSATKPTSIKIYNNYNDSSGNYGCRSGLVYTLSAESLPAVNDSRWLIQGVKQNFGSDANDRGTYTFTVGFEVPKYLVKTSNGHSWYYNTNWNDLGVIDEQVQANYTNYGMNSLPAVSAMKTLITSTGTTSITVLGNIPPSSGTGDGTAVTGRNLLSTLITIPTTAPDANIVISGIPKDQFVYATGDIDLKNMANIDWIHMNDGTTGDESGAGKLRFLASVDSGKTWIAYNGSSWVTIIDTTLPADGSVVNNIFVPSSDALARISTSGMTKAVFNAAPWNAYTITAGRLKIRFAIMLSQEALSDAAFADNTKIQYDAPGTWKQATIGTDYEASYSNSTLKIKWLTGNWLAKVNY